MGIRGISRFCALLIFIQLTACSKTSQQTTAPGGTDTTDSSGVISKPLPSLDAGIKISFTDLPYGPSNLQKLDLSLIAGRSPATPFVILLHGGAWSAGDKRDLSQTAAYFVARGINVANVNYRLTNTTSTSIRWTGILSDVNAAITYLQLHSDSLKIRNSDFVLFGFSAGAQLALLHAYSYDSKGLVPAVIGFGSPTKFDDPAWKLNPYLGVAKQALPPLTGQAFSTDTSNSSLRELSPYFGSQLKPTLLIHGDKDDVVPYSQSVLMNLELKTAGIATAFITLAHSGHTGDGATQSDLNNALQQSADWIKTYSH